MNYIKTKILIPDKICNNIDDFLREKSDTFEEYRDSVKSNGFRFKITIKTFNFIPVTSKIKGTYEPRINMVVNIFKGVKRVGKKGINTSSINKLLLIFEIDNCNPELKDLKFLLNVEKEASNTVECAKNRLMNVLKPNISNHAYIKNYILYANFLNKRDLMNICFLLLANKHIIDNIVPMQELIKSKLNYYGYSIEENEAYSYYDLKDMLSSEDAIKTSINVILCSIDTNVIEPENEDICMKMYEKYIDCLSEEGLLLS